MALSSTRKQCVNDGGCKQAAVTNCEGCSKAFCIKHMMDHRRLLDGEMNIIIDEHDHLKNTLNQQTSNYDCHPLIKEIDKWENESIAKIRQRAEELRKELFPLITVHKDELLKRLQQLSEQLKKSREQDDFIETDLQTWKKTLDNLLADLALPSTISINQSDNVSLVQNIFISCSLLDKEEFYLISSGMVRIEENKQLVIHDTRSEHVEIRGKNEYLWGSHKIRLYIEEACGSWMFLGINSKSTPLQKRSYQSKSAYGWSNNNDIWSNGQKYRNQSNDVIEMKKNDIINLILHCDKRSIVMVNERTNKKHELVVNIDHCSFPWQLHINLYEGNSRVRILS